MKKRFLTFILAICLIIPCSIMFTACDGGKNITGIIISITDETTNTITYEYGETVDLFNNINIIATYDDESTEDIELSDASISITKEGSTDVYNEFPSDVSVGTWTVEIKYAEKTATITVIITEALSPQERYRPQLIVDGNVSTSVRHADTQVEIDLIVMNKDQELIWWDRTKVHAITETKYNEIIDEDSSLLTNYSYMLNLEDAEELYDDDIVDLDVGKYYLYCGVNEGNVVSGFTPINVTHAEISIETLPTAEYSYSYDSIIGDITLADIELGRADVLINGDSKVWVKDGNLHSIGELKFKNETETVNSTNNGETRLLEFAIKDDNYKFVPSSTDAVTLVIRKYQVEAPIGIYSEKVYSDGYNIDMTIVDDYIENAYYKPFTLSNDSDDKRQTNAGTYTRTYILNDPTNYEWFRYEDDQYPDVENECSTIDENNNLIISWVIDKETIEQSYINFYDIVNNRSVAYNKSLFDADRKAYIAISSYPYAMFDGAEITLTTCSDKVTAIGGMITSEYYYYFEFEVNELGEVEFVLNFPESQNFYAYQETHTLTFEKQNPTLIPSFSGVKNVITGITLAEAIEYITCHDDVFTFAVTDMEDNVISDPNSIVLTVISNYVHYYKLILSPKPEYSNLFTDGEIELRISAWPEGTNLN